LSDKPLPSRIDELARFMNEIEHSPPA
jgi:hypothetical protein